MEQEKLINTEAPSKNTSEDHQTVLDKRLAKVQREHANAEIREILNDLLAEFMENGRTKECVAEILRIVCYHTIAVRRVSNQTLSMIELLQDELLTVYVSVQKDDKKLKDSLFTKITYIQRQAWQCTDAAKTLMNLRTREMLLVYLEMVLEAKRILCTLLDKESLQKWIRREDFVVYEKIHEAKSKYKHDQTVGKDPNDINFKKSLQEKASPVLIKRYLDKNIIGQENAKRTLSVVMASHLLSIGKNTGIHESTLIIGPTGSGKTQIAKLIAEYTELPYIIVDASQITASGWKGNDKEDALIMLKNKSGEHKEFAEYGIVVLDEIDKLCQGDGPGSDTRYNVKNMNAMLSLLDGGNIMLDKGTSMSTKNIFFILTGAFTDLDFYRKLENKRLGFGNFEKTETQSLNIREELIKIGMIPELAARITNIVFTEAMSEQELYAAVTKTDNSILQIYRSIYGEQMVHIPESTMQTIVRESYDLGLGVRGCNHKIAKYIQERIYRKSEEQYIENFSQELDSEDNENSPNKNQSACEMQE